MRAPLRKRAVALPVVEHLVAQFEQHGVLLCDRVVRDLPDLERQNARARLLPGQRNGARHADRVDRARAQYYKYFTGREYGKQEYYNLGFDSGPLGTEESVECIITILRRWCTVRGTHPLYML